MKAKYNVGDRIYFAEEKRPYIVRACDDRFLICTKPYNFKPKTVIYTIVDLEEVKKCNLYKLGMLTDGEIEQAKQIAIETY